MPEQKICLACGAVIKGRSDKKFCDDQCRNTYNNQQNSDSNNLVRNINRILRKNRRILEELNTGKDFITTMPRERLRVKGYDFNYYTNTLTTKPDKTYFFCYEFGYLPIGADKVVLVKRDNERKNQGN